MTSKFGWRTVPLHTEITYQMKAVPLMTGMKIAAAVALSVLLLAGCANQPAGTAKISTSPVALQAASNGSQVCADLTANHVLILAQGAVDVAASGGNAAAFTNLTTELQSDIQQAPQGLSANLKQVLSALQSINGGRPAMGAADGPAALASTWCAQAGYQVPMVGIQQ